jgi:hypothetical protein
VCPKRMLNRPSSPVSFPLQRIVTYAKGYGNRNFNAKFFTASWDNEQYTALSDDLQHLCTTTSQARRYGQHAAVGYLQCLSCMLAEPIRPGVAVAVAALAGSYEDESGDVSCATAMFHRQSTSAPWRV